MVRMNFFILNGYPKLENGDRTPSKNYRIGTKCRDLDLMEETKTVVFDLGAVLIDWNPRYLYKKIFAEEAKMEWFLEHICTSDWNEEQDAGRNFKTATDLLIQQHPEWEHEILAFWHRWEEMLAGPITGTVEILSTLRMAKRHQLLALTNWSAETFPIAQKKFDFLSWFDGIVMSGEEKTRKPFRDFYQIMLNRYSLKPEQCLFIDDNLRNIEGAAQLGIEGIHFTKPEELKAELVKRSILVG